MPDRVRGDTTTLRPANNDNSGTDNSITLSLSRITTAVIRWATARPSAGTNGQAQTWAASESSAAKEGRQRQTARAEDGTADAAENYGVNWCVGSRGGCHGCTEPAFPDKVGKFYTFV